MTVPQVQIAARNHYLSLPDPLPLNGAIAVPSVLYRESGLRTGSQGHQPSETPGTLNPSGAYGIASWNGPRQGHLKDFCDQRGLAYDSLDAQLDFVLHEAANSYPLSWAAIRSGASFQTIIRTFVEDYERPKAPEPEIADSIRIATALAVVPLPLPGAPRPPPPAQRPILPPSVAPGRAAVPGLPPMAPDAAGRIAAVADAIHRAREDRIAQLIAADPECVAYDAMLAGIGNLQTPALPPPAAIPADEQTQGTNAMPAFLTHILANWMTSGAGTVAGGPAILDILSHGGAANWAQDIPQLATMVVGWLAPDPKTVAK